MMLDLDTAIKLAEQQEEILQLPHFSRKDAWDLGKRLVNDILERNLTLSVSIRLISGLVLFQYFTEGTTIDNERWMTRKFNVVCDLEISSLLNTLRLKRREQTLEDRGLDPKFHALSGGAFPIRVKGSGLIGAVTASGLPHLADHDVVVNAIGCFLGALNYPRIPPDADL
jgi:uncharacterized protein (UPF0303 family)